MLQQFRHPSRQRREVLAEQPRLKALEQPVEHNERLKLARVEPQAGQLVAAALGIAPIGVAGKLVVPFDRGVEMILEEPD